MKATKEQRTICMTKNHAHTSQVLATGVECDDCTAPAIAGSANNLYAVFHCAEHFKAHLARERATRPSREELIRRVNMAIAGARA